MPARTHVLRLPEVLALVQCNIIDEQTLFACTQVNNLWAIPRSKGVVGGPSFQASGQIHRRREKHWKRARMGLSMPRIHFDPANAHTQGILMEQPAELATPLLREMHTELLSIFASAQQRIVTVTESPGICSC